MEQKADPNDVSDQEWALVAPYLAVMTNEGRCFNVCVGTAKGAKAADL